MSLKVSTHSITGSCSYYRPPPPPTSTTSPKNMKCIFFTIVACIIAIEAKPYMGLGLGMGLGNGVGTGLGYGMGGLGLGLGSGGGANGYSQGGGYGGNLFNSGANGYGNQGFHSGGLNNFHNIGQHHNSLSSITQAENTDNHDIGGSQLFDTGALSNGGFNQFGNGDSQFGSGFGSGNQMSTFI